MIVNVLFCLMCTRSLSTDLVPQGAKNTVYFGASMALELLQCKALNYVISLEHIKC